MDACAWPEKMRARCGGDKLGITSSRRSVTVQRLSYVDCLPDLCTVAMFS